jgi:hypothetical protein
LAPLPKNGVTEAVQLPDNKIVVAVVTEIIPQGQAPLSQVESQVRDLIQITKARELVDKTAKQFEARLKANNNDFHKTAGDLGIKVIETNDFERSGQMEGIGPAAYLGEQPFIRPIGTVVSMYRVAQTPYFYKILSRTPPDPKTLDSQRELIVSGVRERKLRERREMFEDNLVRKLTEEGKLKIYDDAVKRLIAAYKS